MAPSQTFTGFTCLLDAVWSPNQLLCEDDWMRDNTWSGHNVTGTKFKQLTRNLEIWELYLIAACCAASALTNLLCLCGSFLPDRLSPQGILTCPYCVTRLVTCSGHLEAHVTGAECSAASVHWQTANKVQISLMLSILQHEEAPSMPSCPAYQQQIGSCKKTVEQVVAISACMLRWPSNYTHLSFWCTW